MGDRPSFWDKAPAAGLSCVAAAVSIWLGTRSVPVGETLALIGASWVAIWGVTFAIHGMHVTWWGWDRLFSPSKCEMCGQTKLGMDLYPTTETVSAQLCLGCLVDSKRPYDKRMLNRRFSGLYLRMKRRKLRRDPSQLTPEQVALLTGEAAETERRRLPPAG